MGKNLHVFFVISILTFWPSKELMSQITVPSDLPSLKLWLDPSSQIISSGTVSEWSDISSQGNNLIQSDISKRPIPIVNGINGYTTVRFDGVNDFLKGNFSSSLSQPNTVAILFKTNNTANNYVFDGGTSYHGARYFSGSLYMRVAGSLVGFSSAAPLPYSVYIFEFNLNQSKIYKNGLLVAQGTLPSSIFDGLTIGSIFDGSTLFMSGDVAEVAIFDNLLSTSERTQIESYFFDKYAPPVDLGADISSYSFCDTILHAGTRFTNWLWSTGETTESITINTSGQYWVEATSIFGTISRDTINVSFPTIPVVSNTLYCNGASINWNADLGPDYTYLWSDASMANNLNIGTPGDYWVELTDTFGCTLRSDTLTFAQDPYAIWLGNDTTLCSGNSVQLQSGAAETVSYNWSDASVGSSLGVVSSGIYWLDGTNNNGCTVRDSIAITVSGIAPVAAFVPSQFCLADTLQLNDQSTADISDPIAVWHWDFGDGTYSSASDTAHLFASASTYNIELYVESAGGCADSITQSVTIYDMPSASFTATNKCLNDTVQFHNSTLPGDGSLMNYSWDFGDPSGTMPNTSTASDPTHYYGNLGTFTTLLTATDDLGCSDQAQVSFTILPVPQAIFTAQNACQASPLTLTNSSTMAAPNTIQSYLWDFDDLTTSSLQLPVKSYANFGYMDITLTVTADNGCSDTAMAQVLIHSLPVVSFTASPACAGNNVVLTDASTVTTGTVAQSDWELDLSVMESGSPLNYSFNTPGSHTVTLTSTSDFSCVSTFSDVVNVYDTLTADWTVSSPVIIPGDNIDFTYTGQNGTVYSWDFGNGQTASTANASTTFSNNSDEAIVSLIVISPEGCEDTLVRSIPIGDPVLDLEVGDIYFQDQNGYYLVAVQLFNRGTLPIDMASIELVMNNGTKVMETYDQVIPYQGSAVLVFDSHPNAYLSLEDSTDAWICAEGTAYSSTGYLETILDNNRNCKNREGKRPVIIGPHPNPADQYMMYTLVLSKTENVTLELIDMRGRVVARPIDHVAMGKGSYPNTIDLSELETDMYLLRLRTDDYEEVLRLVVR